mmetsp:Transcript_58341/g.69645  ORF Transcript_58341/g.69645 Transcript_58341/m.69645 type:complete len:83 (-) Transcript_58341:849-1097(-)
MFPKASMDTQRLSELKGKLWIPNELIYIFRERKLLPFQFFFFVTPLACREIKLEECDEERRYISTEYIASRLLTLWPSKTVR